MSASVEEFIEVLNAEQYIDLRKLQDYARHGCKPSVRGETWLYLLRVLSSDKSQEMTSVRSQYLFYEHMDKSIPRLEKSIRSEASRYYKRRLVSRAAPGRTLARSALRIHDGGARRGNRGGRGASHEAMLGSEAPAKPPATLAQDQGPNRVDSDQARPLAGIMGRSGDEQPSLERNVDVQNGNGGGARDRSELPSSMAVVDEDPEAASANEMKRFNAAISNVVCAYLNKGRREAEAERSKRDVGGAGGPAKGKEHEARTRERSLVGFIDDASSGEDGAWDAPKSSSSSSSSSTTMSRQRRATSSGSSAGSITAASMAASSAARLRGLALSDEVQDGAHLEAGETELGIASDWAYPQIDAPLGASGDGEDDGENRKLDGRGMPGDDGSDDEEEDLRRTLSPHQQHGHTRTRTGASDDVRSRRPTAQSHGGSEGPLDAGEARATETETVLEPDLIALAAPFVKCIRVEAGMYFAFERLMGMIEEHYSRRPLPECVSDFLTLFRTTLPDLYAYFEEEEVDVVGFSSAWLRHLLAAEMRIEDLLLLWDSYFSMPDPLELHMYVCIAVLANCKDALEELDQSEANSMLLSLPPLDVDRIINEATNIKLSHRQSQMEG